MCGVVAWLFKRGVIDFRETTDQSSICMGMSNHHSSFDYCSEKYTFPTRVVSPLGV